MPKKIITMLLGLIMLCTSGTAALGQEIPAGYALIPISSLTGQNFRSPNPTPISVVTSAEASALRAVDEIGYLGEASQITASLRDATNQPVANHNVVLISSRTTDKIQPSSAITDINGEAIFGIQAAKDGISSFTAVDQTSGITIAERPRVVFLKSNKPIGGNYLRSDVLGVDNPNLITANAAYTGKIQATFPDSITAGIPFDITIKITDLSGNALENFIGNISFSSTDSGAILPRDYTFKEVEKGVHVFAKAVTFSSIGSKTITIKSGDTMIAPNTLSVTVKGAEASVAEKPVILQPTSGSTTNQTITLKGLATANSNLGVFVNGQYFVSGSSNMTGSFELDADLPDGRYDIAIATLLTANTAGSTSDSIKITVDTTTPELAQIVLDPGNKATTKDNISVIIQSEVDLTEAVININNKNIICSNEGEGFYQAKVGTLSAGDYPIAVMLTDSAGNSADLSNAATLKITETKPQITIKNITTTPKDKRVDIIWEAPANQAEVDHYAIFYGMNAANLSQVFETADRGTGWYIGNLNNDTEYTFQIVSLDAAGAANGYSQPFTAIPASQLNLFATGCDSKLQLVWRPQPDNRISSYRLDYGLQTGEYLESRVLPDGASRNEWEIRDLTNGKPYFITLRGLDASGNVIFDPQEEISASPIAGACHGAAKEQPIQLQIRQDENGKTILTWNPVSGAIGYKIYAGKTPNYFDLPVVTIKNTSFRPDGLTANSSYYFAVRAVYSDKEAATFSNVAKIEVGPVALLGLAAIMALLGGYLWVRRQSILELGGRE